MQVRAGGSDEMRVQREVRALLQADQQAKAQGMAIKPVPGRQRQGTRHTKFTHPNLPSPSF